MKNLITYLKALWRRVADSQSNDISLDCRLTVVRPSFDCRSSLLKLVSVLVLILTIGSGNAWGADTFETSTFTDKYGNVGDDEPEWSCPTGENGFDDTYGIMYSTVANSGRTVSLTSDAFDGKKIKSVSVVVRRNKSYAITLAVTVGSTTLGSGDSGANNSQATLTTSDASGIDAGTITVTLSTGAPKSKPGSLYVKSITVTYEDAVPTTTVTADPTSITFANNTLDGSGEASGSSTVDLSVSNGNKSGGNYLWVVVESDNEDDCVFTINSGAYSYGSGNNTSIDDLSVEYYAISAGTWDGRIIAQGYNSSYEAVNCTIPLRVTITAPACAYSMTISKGTGTNCTFSLGTSGSGIATCSGASTTVSITPTDGYGTPVVSQSGASKTPSITGSGNSQTVTYQANTTGTSTINVSCSANEYTITLDKDLTPTTAGTASITATYNSNSNLTSAITKPTKTGWTFGGYFTAKNGGGTQIIDASGNVIASVSGYTDASRNWKYAGSITLYAKWTCTVTWSVNGLTNVYSTQTVTYNSSGSKVASVPTPDPASYCGDIFAGWSQKNAGSESKTTSYYDDLFKTVGDSPDIKNIGNITFYAVFADEE